jgi:hypothetical protein
MGSDAQPAKVNDAERRTAAKTVFAIDFFPSMMSSFGGFEFI